MRLFMRLRKAVASMGPPPVPNRAKHPFVGTIDVAGMRVLVENAKGDVRAGVDPDGHPWSVTMRAPYGEIEGTEGCDGEPVDAYVGPDLDAPMVYVIHQKVPGTAKHDEDKLMLGFASQADAVKLYRKQYTKPGFYGGCTTWPVGELRDYLRRHEHKGKRLDTPRRVQLVMRGRVEAAHPMQAKR